MCLYALLVSGRRQRVKTAACHTSVCHLMRPPALDGMATTPSSKKRFSPLATTRPSPKILPTPTGRASLISCTQPNGQATSHATAFPALCDSLNGAVARCAKREHDLSAEMPMKQQGSSGLGSLWWAGVLGFWGASHGDRRGILPAHVAPFCKKGKCGRPPSEFRNKGAWCPGPRPIQERPRSPR